MLVLDIDNMSLRGFKVSTAEAPSRLEVYKIVTQ